MVRPREIETDQGIQGELNVDTYDRFLRRMRDKGWMETNRVIKCGITRGSALEIGPGPGYLGLEWLRMTEGTDLKCAEISPDMINIAEKNAKEYGLEKRVTYVKGDAQRLPFDENTFDAVFTNGSLHEWSEPAKIFREIFRVLKPGGRYFVSDLRRDMNPLIRWLMRRMTKPKEILPGLVTSLNAAYTPDELREILRDAELRNAQVTPNAMGIEITGSK